MKDKQTPSLSNDFDRLMNTYMTLLEMCLEGMDPATPEERRNEIIAAVKQVLGNRPDTKSE